MESHLPDAGPGEIDAKDGGPRPQALRAWFLGQLTALVLLSGLGWILARLVWLPFYFGLFFFLIAGLLVGAVAFRVARPSRPLGRTRILVGVVAVSVIAWSATLILEFRHVAATIGDPPAFASARNAAAESNGPVKAIKAEATERFLAVLSAEYPPGGPIGYVRWAVCSGEMKLTVSGCQDQVSISQRGYAWPCRALATIVLMAAGLWSNLESLRSADPVSVFLVPGEEAEETD